MEEHGHVQMFRPVYEPPFSGLEEDKSVSALTVRLGHVS
jgi:hypothetical protein